MKFSILGFTISNEKPSNATKCFEVDPRLLSFAKRQKEADEFSRNKIMQQHKRNKSDADDAMRKMELHLRKASMQDYKAWLNGFLSSGGNPTHYYDYPFTRWDNFYVALEDLELSPLYGASSINIIVPIGVKVTGKKGHIGLFFYDNFATDGGIVPVFVDTM
jgi:hypothetical protein